MERRGCGLGFIVATLGLLLSCCLFPHLVSSIYAVISTLLQEPTAATWLWGDWLSTLPLVKESQGLYMILAEGPICCAGSLALLVALLGLVALIASLGRGRETYYEEYGEYPGDDEYQGS